MGFGAKINLGCCRSPIAGHGAEGVTMLGHIELCADGLYRNGKRVGTIEGNLRRVRVNGVRYSEKYLVYLKYHEEWPDYELINHDGDPNNNGVLNLLEEGETLIRLKCGLRFDPSSKKYYRRVYRKFGLRHKYVEVLKEGGYY